MVFRKSDLRISAAAGKQTVIIKNIEKSRKPTINPHQLSDQSFRSTIVNQALSSCPESHLKLRLRSL